MLFKEADIANAAIKIGDGLTDPKERDRILNYVNKCE